MPKKSTKLEQLSEKIHITIEEMRNLGVEDLDHMFLEIYVDRSLSLLIPDNRRKSNIPSKMLWGLFSLQSLPEMMNGHT